MPQPESFPPKPEPSEEEKQEKIKKLKKQIFELASSVSPETHTIQEAKEIVQKVRELEREIRKLEGKEEETSLEQAQEIMKQDFMGPEQVKKAFGIEIPEEEIPPIPFSPEELEQAKELGQFLVLRYNKAPDGEPLTIKKMNEMLQDKFTEEDKGEILFNIDWYKNEDFFTKQTPHFSWSLVTKKVLGEGPEGKDFQSTSKNYLEQTQILIDYLKNKVFKDQELPEQYQEAIEEFNHQKKEIEDLMSSDWEKAAEKLSQLKINQLLRRTPSEILYDTLLYFQNTGERLLKNRYDWSKTQSSDSKLVRVGNFDSGGASVHLSTPDNSRGDLGFVLSRTL